MRNLKRALSLLLSSAMVLGMVVMGSSAASYQDVDAADNLEAIEVLQAVGIMEGDENGNFNPDKNVTRNEMAVVMCNLLGLTPGGTSPFTDVPAWAQPYVAACYNNDIIAGISATQFGGDSNITAVQAGLMVMKALGYFTYQGEFGDDWALATVKQAAKIDLYDGINAYTEKVMTRNEIAQMVLNALECTVTVVEQIGGMNVEGNGIIVTEKPTYKYTAAENKSGSDYAGRGMGLGLETMELCEKLYGSDLKMDGSASDDFGRPANQWTYKDTTIKAVKEATLTYTTGVKGKTIYEDLGKLSGTSLAALDINHDGTSAGDGAGIYVDGYEVDATTVGGGFAVASANNVEIGGKGTLTQVYYDRDTKVITVTVTNTYLAQAASDYNKEDDELTMTIVTGDGSFTNTLKGEDFAITGYAEDDFILVNAVYDGTNYNVKAIAPATVVEDAKVSVYKADSYVTANGTKYEYNVVTNDGNTTTNSTTSNILGQGQIGAEVGSTYALQDTGYNLILDSYGYVIGVEAFSDAANLNNYLFVKDAAKSDFDYKAKVVFMDGTSKTVVVAKTAKVGGTLTDTAEDTVLDGTALASNGDLSYNRFYTYTVNKDGSYNLTDLADTTRQVKITDDGGAGDANINPDASNAGQVITDGASSPSYAKPVTSKTVFVAKDKAYIGVKNAPKVVDADVYCLYDATGNYTLAAFADKKGVSVSDSTEYVYILNDTAIGHGKDENDNLYYVYDAVVDGKKTTINASNSSLANGIGLYAVASYTEGYADLDHSTMPEAVDAGSGVAQNAISYQDGTLTVSSTTYVLDDNVKFIYVDGTDGKATKTVSAGYMNTLTAGTYNVELVKTSSTSAEIATVYVYRAS